MTADAVGGVWTYATELCRALARRGVRVALVVLGPLPSPAQRAEALSIAGLRLIEWHVRLEWMDDAWGDVDRSGRWLLDLEARLHPQIVHLNGYCHAALPFRAPVVAVGHSCVLGWSEAVRCEGGPAALDEYRRRVARGLRAAALVAAPTRAMLCTLERFYGPLGKSRVIANGRDPARFHIERKEPVVLAAGRLWDQAKNLRALDAAAASVAWPVLVAGDARHPGGGEVRASHVELLGALAPWRLADHMARAAIYALPAIYEPFGLSPLEAALSGCALVLGDIASLREVWQDAAVFVEPRDPVALAGALNGLIESPDRRVAMARAARQRAMEFTARRMGNSYFAAYRELQADGRGAAA
jgi:glycosyltransferase involved in cell wall biosynthesis